tara:strand:- start:7480 stop:9825 length:2346 start_codon:yes stop_codon:yes gene_type:complete
MVQIPEFKAKTAPTSQTGTRPRPVPDITAAAAAPFEAAADLAADVQAVSKRFYEAQKSLQRKTEATKLIDYLIKGDENNPGLNQLTFDAQNNPDTNTALPMFEQGFTTHKNNILSGVEDNVVKQLVEQKADELYTTNYVDVQASVWKNIRENSIKTLEEDLNREFNQYITAGGNNSKKLAAENSIVGLIEDADRDGILSVGKEEYLQTQMQNLYTLEAELLASENPEVFLKNYENGYYNEKISPQNLVTLKKVAETRKSTNDKATVAGVKTEGNAIAAEIRDFTSITNADYFNINTFNTLLEAALQNDATQKALGLPGLDKEIEQLAIIEQNFDIIQKAKKSTPDNVKETLDRVRLENQRLSKDPNANPFRQKLLIQLEESLASIHSTMLTEMPNNLLNMAEGFDGELKFTELDLLEKDPQAFLLASSNRKKQASEVADFYNVPLQLLKDEEKENIKQILTTGSYDEKVTVLTNLAILGREDLKSVFVQLGMEKEASYYTHVGLMILANGGQMDNTTMSILKGAMIKGTKRDDDLHAIINQHMDKATLPTLLIDYMPTSTVNNLENLMPQIQQSADLIFLHKLSLNENNILELSSEKEIQKLYEQSIQEAAGMKKRGNEYYGGFQDFNGMKILLPQNMPNSEPYQFTKYSSDYPTVQEMLEDALTPELLEKAFTYEFETYSTGDNTTITETKKVLPVTEIDGELSVTDLFEKEGKNIFFDDDGKFLDSIFLETADDGMYYIGLGDPNSGTAEYFRDADGREVLFNLKKIIPDLLVLAMLDE